MKKATAILCADIHLEEEIPVCRTDDYWEAQKTKLKFIKTLKEKHECLVLVAGDVFHKAKSSPILEAMAIREMPEMTGIPGQHDLPYHNLKNFENSSLEVLTAAGVFQPLIGTQQHPFGGVFNLLSDKTIGIIGIMGFPFGVKFKSVFDNEKYETPDLKVALLHKMVHKDKKIQGMKTESSAGLSLLKESDYDLIVTGDNHMPFTVEHQGRLLVNCGSMMRRTADQQDYKPAVWLWYAETNTVEQVFLPIVKDVVSRTHIEDKVLKDQRMTAFVEGVDGDYEIALSFKKNIKAFFEANNTRKGVVDTFYKALGE